MTDQPSICVGCKWAGWAESFGANLGRCGFPESRMPAAVAFVLIPPIYRKGHYALRSCPVREPEELKE